MMTKGKTGKKEDCIMKKVFYLIGAFLMLAACSKNVITDQPASPDNLTEDATEFKVSLTISRADTFGGEPETRATVKKEWADGDVVFVFFQGVSAPKYLEMKYTGGEWVATFKNDLAVSALGTSGTMTAVFLPYGSCSTVSADARGNFKFDPMYQGVYLQTEQVAYTCNSGELSGKLTLAAPQLDEGGKYIHFDASGYDASHSYTLYQDYVSSVTFIGVASNGIVPLNVGTPGGAIPGYVDADKNILSFSGVLDASAVGKAVDYQFSINDAAASVLYTRDAGTKTLSSSKYIGIGNLSSTPWNAMGYVDLGVEVDGKPLYWATRNLGATAETGEGSWGNYYAWSETTGYPLTGTFKNYSSEHDFSTVPAYECYGDSYDIPKNYYYLPQYDPARATLGGLWRTPSPDEFQKLKDATAVSYDMGFGTLEHEYVDMGENLGWAKNNLGASSVNEYGNLYAWGETEPKDRYTESNYRGNPSVDPATALWGAPWRTPTAEELENVLDATDRFNYSLTWTNNYNGVSDFNGWVLSYQIDYSINVPDHQPSLIFPAAGEGNDGYYYDNGYHYYGNNDPKYRGSWGRYWTSTPYDDRHMIWMYAYNNVNLDLTNYPDYYGFSIRPVIDLGSVNAGVTLTGKNEYSGKSIFLPSAGYIDGNNPEEQGFGAYYWTCERYPSSSAVTDAMRASMSHYSSFNTGSAEFMRCGLPVRPVFTLDGAEIIKYEFPEIYNLEGLNDPSDYIAGGDPFND